MYSRIVFFRSDVVHWPVKEGERFLFEQAIHNTIPRKERRMRKAVGFSFAILIVGCLAVTAFAADPFTIGETWTYKHEGAIPMRPPDATISGDRVREVVAVKEENEKKFWLIQERWGTGDEWAGKSCVDANRMFSRIESGENRIVTIEPSTPFDFLNMKPGEEKSVESTFKFGDQFSFPRKLAVKRVQDETIKVPAGEFENCIHIQCEESITFSAPDGGDSMTIVTKREQWYSPKVNGLIKDVFTTKGPGGQEEKGTSELKSYTKTKEDKK